MAAKKPSLVDKAVRDSVQLPGGFFRLSLIMGRRLPRSIIGSVQGCNPPPMSTVFVRHIKF